MKSDTAQDSNDFAVVEVQVLAEKIRKKIFEIFFS